MKIKTAKLTGVALGWAVAESRGHANLWMHDYIRGYFNYPSVDWAQGGPIKTDNNISTQKKHDGWWLACIYDINDEMTHIQLAHSELEAAMRCYVTSKLGDEVEVPDELA